MLRFALKNLAVRKGKVFLSILSIVFSASVALLAYNVATQVRGGIVDTAGYYDLIIGPAGSSTQLAMNTMFFTDQPLGTIPYSLVEELQENSMVQQAVPFLMGDSYNSARIVGSTPALLEGKELREGEMFSQTFDAVLGAAVAEKYGLKVGDEIVTSHGLTGNGTEHAAQPLRVTGILKTTHTAYDNQIFTSYETVWAVHGHSEEEEEEHDEEEEHVEEGEVCAILVRTRSFNDYYQLSEYYASDASLLVINPATVLREVLENVDVSAKIVYILCGIILGMNVLVISVITLLNLLDAKKEIALMRLIGVSMEKIALMHLIQNGLAGIAAVGISLGVSRLCLVWMSDYVSSMGIVLNAGKVYPAEGWILLLVFAISILPTVACVFSMSRRDGLEN